MFRVRHCRRQGWSTGGLTSTSTGSRPVENQRRRNAGVLVGFPASGETITSSTSRRIPMATAGSEGVGFPSKSRSYRWGRRRSRSYTEGSGREVARLAASRLKTLRVSPEKSRARSALTSTESTGGLVLGKSAGKCSSCSNNIRARPIRSKFQSRGVLSSARQAQTKFPLVDACLRGLPAAEVHQQPHDRHGPYDDWA